MSTTPAPTWLTHHVGNDHRLYALDSTHLRCKDCQQTGLIPPTTPDPTDPRSSIPPITAAVPTRGRRDIPNVGDPNACALHPGYWADNCGPCRSELIGRDPDQAPPVPPPTSAYARPQDNPEWQAMRATLAQRKKTR